MPTSRLLCQTVLSPFIEAKMVDQIGTVAINSPAKPEEIFFSALVIRIHGIIISNIA